MGIDPRVSMNYGHNLAQEDENRGRDQIHDRKEEYDDTTIGNDNLMTGNKEHLPRLIATVSTHSNASSRISAPPDGGARAWTMAAMGHLVVFTTWGYIASFSVFESYYVNSLGKPASDISWIGTFEVFLLFFLGTLSGRALDAGLFKWVFGAGVVVLLLGVFMTSLATDYYQVFLAQGVCIGIGVGLMFCPALTLVSTYFSRRRAMSLAICASGTATGGVVFPVIVQQLLPKLGFGWTVRILGFIILFMNIFTLALLRARLAPRKAGPLVEWLAFKDLSFDLFMIGMFLLFWSVYFAFFYIGTFTRSVIGVGYEKSINILLVLNAIGAPARLIPAYLADTKVGPLNAIIPAAFGASACFYTWAAVKDLTGLYIWACFYGIFGAAIQGLWPAALSAFNEDPKKAGTRMGMGFTIVSFACLTGSPLGGALVQLHHGNYLYGQMWAGSCMLLGGCFLVAARVSKTGWKLRVKV